MTDPELVARAAGGDTEAFDQLVRRHQSAAYRAALAALRNPHDAEEATQDGFVRAWTRIGRFRGESSFKTWLLAIVWNQAMSRRRGVMRWWQRTAPIEEADGMAATTSASLPGSESELRRHVTAAIEALTPRLRDAFLLAQSGEYEYEAIGAMLKIPVGTVKWRVSEARRKVRAHLAALGYVDAQ